MIERSEEQKKPRRFAGSEFMQLGAITKSICSIFPYDFASIFFFWLTKSNLTRRESPLAVVVLDE